MKLLFRLVIATLILLAQVVPSRADSLSPSGLWEATNGESRYLVSLCGDGTQLCAYVIWIRPDVLDANNRRYLNRPVFRNLARTGPNRWAGEIVVEGRSVNGTVEQISANELKVTACVMMILCSSGVMPRIGG